MSGQSQRRGPGRRWCLRCRKRRTTTGYDYTRDWCRPCTEKDDDPTTEAINVGQESATEKAVQDFMAFSALVRAEQGV